jgi:predicted nuclease with RNAse H fold
VKVKIIYNTNMDTFTFIGIDVNSRPPYYHVIAIDSQLNCLSELTGDWEALNGLLAQSDKGIIAINAPLSMNTGYLTQSNLPKLHPGRWPNCRRIEFELAQHGAPVYFTPNDPRKMPAAMSRGFTISRLLIDLGYELFTAQTEKSMIEVPADAAFWSIGQGEMLDQHQLLGRIQRQMILYELGFQVPDPMEFFEEITRFKIKMGNIPLDLVLTPQQLNARIVAYTSQQLWENPEKVAKLGYQQEGFLYLPADPSSLLPVENAQ